MKKEAAQSDPQDRKVRSDPHDLKTGSDPQDRAMTTFERPIKLVEDEEKMTGWLKDCQD